MLLNHKIEYYLHEFMKFNILRSALPVRWQSGTQHNATTSSRRFLATVPQKVSDIPCIRNERYGVHNLNFENVSLQLDQAEPKF